MAPAPHAAAEFLKLADHGPSGALVRPSTKDEPLQELLPDHPEAHRPFKPVRRLTRTSDALACGVIRSRSTLTPILGEPFAVIRYIANRRSEPPPG